MADARIDVFWHAGVLDHDTGRGVFDAPSEPFMAIDEAHPENADRLRNMHAILEKGPLAARLDWHAGRLAGADELTTFHSPAHVEKMRTADAAGGERFLKTTLIAPGSYDACRAAAGTALAATAHVMDGEGKISYALVRPPGHHAAPAQVDGYCIFNSTALATQLARDRGAARVAVIDWDVHHGNGTQEGFYERDDVLTVSLHMNHGPWGWYHPQTGQADEVGRGKGRGFNLNVPLPMGSGDEGYNHAMEQLVIPAVDAFRPEMIVVACGQDANQFDPNGRQCLTMQGFHRLGVHARALAERHSGGRLCLVQEGGYALSYAAYCLYATLAGVLGAEIAIEDPVAFYPEYSGPALAAIEAIGLARATALAD
ncbi:MAG: class II histone deacetylase [Alphaproteobacteria bacterium]